MKYKNTLTHALTGLLIFSFSTNVLALKASDDAQPKPSSRNNTAPTEALSIMSDEEKEEITKLSRLTTRYQLSADKEKYRVELLKNKLTRLKIEKEINTLNGSNDVDVNMLSGISLPPIMPPPMPTNEPEIEPKKEPVKPRKPPRPYLIQVMGANSSGVKAKIFYDGKTSEYQLGDPLAGSVLSDIKADSITLSNGKHYDIGIN